MAFTSMIEYILTLKIKDLRSKLRNSRHFIEDQRERIVGTFMKTFQCAKQNFNHTTIAQNFKSYFKFYFTLFFQNEYANKSGSRKGVLSSIVTLFSVHSHMILPLVFVCLVNVAIVQLQQQYYTNYQPFINCSLCNYLRPCTP